MRSFNKVKAEEAAAAAVVAVKAKSEAAAAAEAATAAAAAAAAAAEHLRGATVAAAVTTAAAAAAAAEVSSADYAYSKLGRSPGAKAQVALEAAVARVGIASSVEYGPMTPAQGEGVGYRAAGSAAQRGLGGYGANAWGGGRGGGGRSWGGGAGGAKGGADNTMHNLVIEEESSEGLLRLLACEPYTGGGDGDGDAPWVTVVARHRPGAAPRSSGDARGDGGGGGSTSKPVPEEGVGDRAAGNASQGALGGYGADARDGGRGGGQGGGGTRGKRGFDPRLNDLIVQEESPTGLLRLLAVELGNFGNVNVATTFSKFGKLCGAQSFPRNIAADDWFRRLMALARDMCDDERLQARELANIMHAVAKMCAAGKLATNDSDVQDTLAALEKRAVLVASDMNCQEVAISNLSYATLGLMPGAEARAVLEASVVRLGRSLEPRHVSNILWSFATLVWGQGDETRAALEAAVVRVGPDMDPQHVSISCWAFATLIWEPGDDARAALEAAVVRVGHGMNPQEVSNTLWALPKLGWKLGAEARTVLEAAVVRVGPDMNAQDVSNVSLALAKLRLMPRAKEWAALGAAVVRVGSTMTRQEVSNTILAHAMLGRKPGPKTWQALEVAVVRLVPRMNAQEVSNTLWSFVTLAATRGAPLPACYPSLWRAARGFDVGSLQAVDLRMLFHAHLMLTELVSRDVRGEVTFPPWIMREARDAWMRNAQDNVTVSSWVDDADTILNELGVPHVVERRSKDGYFSVDVYLPDDDVALEFDGPTHFINDSSIVGDGVAPGVVTRTSTNTNRTVRTELRDMFLARRHHAVVSVPWFEWNELSGSVEKTKYVVEMLRGVGVHVPSSAAV